MSQSKEEKLAYEIAHALHDTDSIAQHIKFAHKYSEEHLKAVLMKVLSAKNIRNKGAYYTSIINRNGGYNRD